MKPGTLSITTEPSPLALSVYDAKFNVVTRTVSPAQGIQLAPGIYFIRASRPLNPDLTALAQVTEGKSGSVHLTIAPSIVQRVLNFRAPVLEPVSTPDAKLPLAPPETLWVRFVWLYDWDTAQLLPPLSITPRFEPRQLVLELINTHLRIVFVQIAGTKGPPLNVALPPAGFARPAQCEIAISQSPSGLVPKVRLSTAWANSAVQYMAQGYLDQAARVCTTAAKEQPAGHFGPFYRFEDPAAALVNRYVRLRTAAAPALASVGDLFLDPIQNFADGLILSAETLAREEKPADAARQILRIRPGALPLYTDGFSLLMNRLRELLDDGGGSLDETTVSKLRSLKRTLGKWARYVDLASPTLTFPGADASSPELAVSGEPGPSQGWLPIRQSSVLESVQQKLEAIKLDAIPPAPPVDEKQQEISTLLVSQIERFSAACIQRYRRIKFAGNLLTVLGLGAAWGIIAAGTYRQQSLVVLFAAASTAVLAMNRWFGFQARAQRYRTLISEARILATEAKNSRISAPAVVRRLRKLIDDRAAADLS